MTVLIKQICHGKVIGIEVQNLGSNIFSYDEELGEVMLSTGDGYKSYSPELAERSESTYEIYMYGNTDEPVFVIVINESGSYYKEKNKDMSVKEILAMKG